MARNDDLIPQEVAADIQRLLTFLKDAAATARGLQGLPEHLRLLQLAVQQNEPPPPRIAPRPQSPAEAAAEISGELLVLAAHAEFSGLTRLARLIGAARDEADSWGNSSRR